MPRRTARFPTPLIVVFVTLVTVLAGCSTQIADVADPNTSTTASSTSPEPVQVAPPTSLDTTSPPPTTPAPTAPPTTEQPATTTTLPDPATLPQSGSGEFVAAAPGRFEVAGTPMIEFSVAVEEGSGVDVEELTDFVVETLGDQRSWIGRGAGFRLVDEGGLFTLVVATPVTVDELCRPLDTAGRYSCASNGWVALNLLRWETATEDWPADLITYRRYLVNHEVGHYIHGPDHDSCPGPGEPAPIMMQQTISLDGCMPNGWVDP